MLPQAAICRVDHHFEFKGPFYDTVGYPVAIINSISRIVLQHNTYWCDIPRRLSTRADKIVAADRTA
jgi:hypothetical protein